MDIRKDIRIDTGNCHFTLRAAALILKDDHLLVVKHDDCDFYYTIGGGVQINESTEDAVLREILEETGIHATIGRLAYIHERFYQARSEIHHEVTFFYLIDSTNLSIQNGTCTDHVHERMYWLPMKQLPGSSLVPEFLRKELLNISPILQHIVSNETC